MWKQQGIDSGLFSRSLMRYAEQVIKEGATNPVKGESPCLGQSEFSHVSHMFQVLVHALWDVLLGCRAEQCMSWVASIDVSILMVHAEVAHTSSHI